MSVNQPKGGIMSRSEAIHEAEKHIRYLQIRIQELRHLVDVTRATIGSPNWPKEEIAEVKKLTQAIGMRIRILRILKGREM